MTTFNIVVWNAYGLTKHLLELRNFVKTNNADIILISETHFISKSLFSIRNYTMYHTINPDGTAHGGTAILIKNNIKHYEASKFQKDYLQATSIKIVDSLGEITVIVIYCPPKHTVKKEFEEFFLLLGKRFIAAGDYNAKHTQWGSRLITIKGRELYKAVVSLRLDTVSTGEPTYWPSDRRKTPDLIDFAVIKGLSKLHFKAKSCLEMSSDHSPVLICYTNTIQNKEQDCRLSNKKINWPYFREQIINNLEVDHEMTNPDEITRAVEHFNNSVQKAAWNATPFSPLNNSRHDCPTLIKEKIVEKRRLRKQ